MLFSNKDRPPMGGRQGSILYPLIINPTGLIAPCFDGEPPWILRAPSRKVPLKRGSLAGVVPFTSLNRCVGFESSYERDGLILLRAVEHWVGVLEQPVCLDLGELGFGRGRYTPDLISWVKRADQFPDQVTLIEVKPEAVLRQKWDRIRPKLLAARRFARLQGWRFKLVTDRHLRLPEVPASTWPRRLGPKIDLVSPSQFISRLFINEGV